MAVIIGLTRRGQNKLPFYRVVVKERGTKRDGNFIEIVGTHDPLKDPAATNLKEDRIKYWIGEGAQPTRVVADMIKKSIPGYWEEIVKSRTEKVQAKRKARKARAKKAA